MSGGLRPDEQPEGADGPEAAGEDHDRHRQGGALAGHADQGGADRTDGVLREAQELGGAAGRGRVSLRGGKTPYRRTTLATDVATTIVAAMQRHGVRRLLVASSVGVGDSTANISLLVKIVVATFLRASTTR